MGPTHVTPSTCSVNAPAWNPQHPGGAGPYQAGHGPATTTEQTMRNPAKDYVHGMRRTITVASVLLLSASLTACGHKADTAACEKVMRSAYASATANPDATPASRPAACNGVPDKTLNDIASRILAGN